jgi:hypothetical protein
MTLDEPVTYVTVIVLVTVVPYLTTVSDEPVRPDGADEKLVEGNVI